MKKGKGCILGETPAAVMPTSGKAPDVGHPNFLTVKRRLKIGPTRRFRKIDPPQASLGGAHPMTKVARRHLGRVDLSPYCWYSPSVADSTQSQIVL